jgi:hypothetical protein
MKFKIKEGKHTFTYEGIRPFTLPIQGSMIVIVEENNEADLWYIEIEENPRGTRMMPKKAAIEELRRFYRDEHNRKSIEFTVFSYICSGVEV